MKNDNYKTIKRTEILLRIVLDCDRAHDMYGGIMEV